MKQLYENMDTRENWQDGWLDRYGRFHPCKFNHHDLDAIKLQKKLGLKKSLEYLGWIRVHAAGVYFFKANSWHRSLWLKITESQRKWLIDNGYEIVE